MKILIPLLIVAVLFYFAHKRTKRIDEQWRKAAEALGCSFDLAGLGGTRSIHGKVDGYQVNVETFTRAAGKSRRTFTRYTVTYAELPAPFRIRSEGLVSTVKRAFGAVDIEVGERSFDEAVLVEGPYAEEVQRFLTPMRRHRIQRALARFRGLELTNRQIEYVQPRTATEDESLVGHVRELVRLADVLHARERQLEEGVGAEREVAAEPVAEDLEDATVRAEEARARAAPFAAPAPALPDAPPVVLELPAEERTAVPPLPTFELEPVVEPVAEEPAAPAPAPVADTSDLAAICAELFAEDLSSTEAQRLYESRFDGRDVRGAGALAELDDFSYDYVFGRGPGSKALVKVHEGDDPYGRHEVHAVVQLPREVAETLRERVGEPLAFEGRLVRCDPFLRRLFVAEATVG